MASKLMYADLFGSIHICRTNADVSVIHYVLRMIQRHGRVKRASVEETRASRQTSVSPLGPASTTL